MKQTKTWFYALLLIIGIVQNKKSIAQKGPSCDSAKAFSYPISNSETSYTNDYYWFKVTLDAGDYNIKVTNLPSIGKIVNAEVYTGTCSSLSLIRKDSIIKSSDTILNIPIHNSITTTSFYVKLYNRGGAVSFNKTMATSLNIVGQIGFCPGQQVTLSEYSPNSTGTTTFTWQPGGSNTSSITFTPTNTTSPTTYTLTYNDAGGTLTTTVNIFPLSPNECKNCELIQNGHFEWYNTFSTGVNNLANANFWQNPTIASPDYFNSNFSAANVDVPTNGFALNTPAYSGNGYAGFGTYASSIPNFREYVQNTLACPLVVGQGYRINFYTINANYSAKSTNNIGVHLSTTAISGAANTALTAFTPQLNYTTPITYSNTWTQITGTVSGNNQQFITIGNFSNDAGTSIVNSTSPYGTTFGGTQAYYFVDNISITPLTPTLSASTTTVNCGSPSSITLTAIGSSSVHTTWTNGTNTYSGSVVTVPSPTVTTTYTCNVNLPCSTCSTLTQTITVTFVPTPTITAVANPSLNCASQPSTLTASGATSYTWSNGATTPTTVVTPSVTTIYTVTGSTSGCVSTQTVAVTINAGQFCCQTASFAIGSATVANTNYSNNSNGGGSVIDVLGTITFTANSTMTNYKIRMAPTASININTGVTVTFSNCTIFSCTDLWGGIFINDGVGVPGIVNVIGSRIEDMYMGIRHSGFNSSATGAANFINVSNSVLNNNYVAIQLINYPQENATALRQGLSVTGSTISSQYSATSPQNTLKSSTIYTYAYNNINSTSTPYVNFPRGIAGIYLYNLEEIPVILGDSTGAAGTNRFENLDFGVYAENASIKAFNNHFINLAGSNKQGGVQTFPPTPLPPGPDEIGVGIYATITNGDPAYWVRVGKVAGTSTPTGGNPYPAGNKFEDCGKGIAITNYVDPFVKGNVFTATNTSIPPTLTPSSLYSYYKAQSGVFIKEIKSNATVMHNYFLNHSAGVYTSHNINTSLGLPTFVKVENNLIEAPGTNGYCRQAIQVDQPLSTTNLGTGLLTVKNNTIQNVYNGIRAFNVKGGLQINSNPTINLSAAKMLGVPGLNATQINNYARTGIYVQSCQDAVVANNPNITSNGTINASYYTAVKGIWFNASSGTTGQVNCNVINNMGRFMQFSGTSLNKISKNVMNGSGDYQGFVLALSGVIGTQGSTSLTNDNEWNGFTGGSAQYAETYTENSNTANTGSILYIKTGSPYEPTQNYSNNGNPYVTGGGSGIRPQSISTPGETCLALRMMSSDNSNTDNGSNSMRMASDFDTTNADIFEALASDTTFYEVYQNETQYRNKQLVYELINTQSIDATQTLNNFYEANQNSNYQTLTTINDAFANADYQTAQTINSSLTANNLIEEYQKRVNELLIKYINYQSQPVDSNATPFTNKVPVFNATELSELSIIANSCFDKYGNVITQARVLMNNVSNTIIEFEENCKPEFNQRKGNKQTISNSNKIVADVLPNPNNGNFTLKYNLAQYSNADLIIYDVTGKVLSKTNLLNTINQLDMNVSKFESGIYYYTIRTANEILITNKFVIIK